MIDNLFHGYGIVHIHKTYKDIFDVVLFVIMKLKNKSAKLFI